MISVCIPVFNYDVRPLVRALAAQKNDVDAEVEIICIDDCSTDDSFSLNSETGNLCRWIRLEENIGRARIRNKFLKYASGEWMLFLDNDGIIPEGFLQRYVNVLNDDVQVVVGGRVYDRRDNDEAHALRYRYGVQVESRSSADRSRNPYRSFMTNNFLIRREVLQRIRFDERLTGYGHEDTLFGFRLLQQGVPILHVDNAVVNADVEENSVFLAKSEEGVCSLAQVYLFMCGDVSFCQTVRLLSVYRHLQRLHLTGLAYGPFRLLRRPLREHFLVGKYFSISEFNYYKLGLFIESIRKQTIK